MLLKRKDKNDQEVIKINITFITFIYLNSVIL